MDALKIKYFLETQFFQTRIFTSSEFTKRLFIRDFCARSGIFKSLQCPELGQNSGGVISDFQIPGQSLLKINWHNSKTSNDIDMKLGPIIKPDKRNKITSKKIGDDAMSANCDVNIIFLIYSQFEAI